MKFIQTSVMALAAVFFLAPAARSDQACRHMSLEDAVNLALANNPVIKQAVQDTKAADARITQARAGFLPSVTATGAYIFAHQVPSFNIPANSFGSGFPPFSINAKLDATYKYNAGFNATWTLFAGGMIWNGYSASKYLSRASSYTAQDTKLGTVFKVKKAYFNLLLASDSVAVIRHSMNLAEEHLQNTRSRFEAGSASELDVLNAKVSLSNLKPQLLAAENGIKLAELNLKNLIGVSFTGTICGNPDIALPALPADLGDLEAETGQHNLQLKALREQIAASRAYRAASTGRFSPALAVTANYDWLTNDFSGTWQPVYQAALVLSLPLFNGGGDFGKVREAGAACDKLLFVKAQVQDELRAALDAVYADAQVAQQELGASKEALSAAQQAETTAEEQYRIGTAINADVLNANVGLREAQLNYIRAKYSYLTALAQLDRIEGKTSY